MYGFSGDFQGIETNGNEGKAQAALCGMSKGNAGSPALYIADFNVGTLSDNLRTTTAVF